MNVLIPVLSFGRAGGNRVLSKLADELMKLGHRVDFLCPDGSQEPYYATNADIKWIDENGSIVPHNNTHSGDNAFTIQRKLKKGLAKIPKCQYDVLIANHSLTVIPVHRTGWASKTLYYVQAYEPDMYRIMGGFRNRLLASLSSSSYSRNLFTVVNADIYLRYKKLSATRTLYPGIDFNLFYPGKTISPGNKIIIGTIGRAERFKGTEYILTAFRILRKKYPGIELHVAFGNPADFEQYEGVICIQPHGDQALADYYRSLSYYFCAAFIQQGAFHYPVAEAMSCGVSVITTQYYPANNDNAWIARACKANDLVSLFEAAQKDPGLKQVKIKQSLEDVKQFDWNLVGKRLDAYLAELVAISTAGKVTP